MGFLSVPNLIPWLNIQSLNRHWSVLLDQIPLQLDREGIKERENDETGGGGWGDDYSRETIISNISIKEGGAIIRGRWLIEGRLLFEEIRYL